MSTFNYHALNDAGQTVRGVIEADSERQARSLLRAQQLKPLQVSLNRLQLFRWLHLLWPQKADDQWLVSRLRGRLHHRLSGKARSLLTRQLASLVQSGMPLDEALHAVANQQRQRSAKAAILQIRSKVLEGYTLAQALAEQPRSFDGLYRSMIAAGESAGYLGQVMEQLADYSEQRQFAQQKLAMALLYPLILLLVSLGVVSLLMTFVVPKLVALFAHRQRDLPQLTEWLISLSHWFANGGLWWLLVLFPLVFLWRQLLKNAKRRRLWHQLLLRVPLLSELLLLADSVRFASTLGMLLKSGVPLLQSLHIAESVLANWVLKEACRDSIDSVEQGGSLSRALQQSDCFPPLLIQMCASGEANGSLDDQLERCATNQQRELEMLSATMLAILEPLVIVVLGAVVTTIVLAVLLPVFELNQLVS